MNQTADLFLLVAACILYNTFGEVNFHVIYRQLLTVELPPLPFFGYDLLPLDQAIATLLTLWLIGKICAFTSYTGVYVLDGGPSRTLTFAHAAIVLALVIFFILHFSLLVLTIYPAYKAVCAGTLLFGIIYLRFL